MVRDPKKWSQLLCTAWCTYQHWSPGPKLPWKRLYHQLQIGLGHLAANNLTHTHTNIWEKYRKVASRGCSLQPTCWYFNLFFPTSPCGVLFFGAASPASPSPPPSPPSVSTSHRINNTNHYRTDITTPSVSRIITPAVSPRHHHTISLSYRQDLTSW